MKGMQGCVWKWEAHRARGSTEQKGKRWSPPYKSAIAKAVSKAAGKLPVPAVEELKVGDRVQLVGLEANPLLNGAFGSLLAFDHDRGRWQIRLDGMEQAKSLRAANVARVALVQAVVHAFGLGGPPQLGGTSAKKRGPYAKTAKKLAALKASSCLTSGGRLNEAASRRAAAAASGGASSSTLQPALHARIRAEAEGGDQEHQQQQGNNNNTNAGGGRKRVQPPTKRVDKEAGANAQKPSKMRRLDSKSADKLRQAAAESIGYAAAVSSVAAGGGGMGRLRGTHSDVPIQMLREADAAADCIEGSPQPRQNKKNRLLDSSSPVAVLLRRLSDEAGTGGRAFARAADAEPEVPDGGAERAELEAEGRRRPRKAAEREAVKQPTKAASGASKAGRAAGRPGQEPEDDDDLFDEDDDLEDEEDVSDMSDAGAPDDEDDEDDEEVWQAVGALRMPDVWASQADRPSPGEEGFRDYASRSLAQAGLGSARSPFVGLGMRLHQESAAFLVHPISPIQRLLVDHATGTGKTLIMLRILENYFDDPRPKIAIFPKERVCDNFYQELLKWPTRWRDYFCFLRPAEAALASGAANWRRKKSDVWDINNERLRFEAKTRKVPLQKVIREIIDSIRDALELKNSIRKGVVKSRLAKAFLEKHPGAPMPRAPLRCFRYTTAGGGACDLGPDGWPKSPILKMGFDPLELNPYSGKVVIMDECHNLVRPTLAYDEQLGRLRDHLISTSNTILAGFTGTPVGNDAVEGRRLLDIIKGDRAKNASDAGFVSSFHARASEDFPREVPVGGVPDGVLHEGMFKDLVKRHSLRGEALKRYLLKEVEFQITPRLLRLPEDKRMARLANYCNMHTHYGAYWGANKAALLGGVKDHAPKFYAVAKSVSKSTEKAVVMLTREMGYRTFLEVMRKTGKKKGFKVATMDELGDFNDGKRNLRGERFRVMVAETSQAGEGVQFRNVRRLYLVDVPARHSDLVQRASRCVRLGGHGELPVAERELAIELHLAQLPKFLRQGLASLIYRELLNGKEVLSIAGSRLEAATEACLKELKRRNIKSILELQQHLQADGGKALIDLLTETALEQIGETTSAGAAPARALAITLWRLRKGGDDLVMLENALTKQVKTADEILLDDLVDKSAELLQPLEAMRLQAVDRVLLAPLGDPPKAPPKRSASSLPPAADEEEEEEDELVAGEDDELNLQDADGDVDVEPEAEKA
ncbi:unnamed protein product [Polarella glacialis]|uniref:Helicase ATP-binding domain-containing protein n=1 Tax=Polarella glacialis TaxID=89957 RepID=A0A813KM82_POLGL|nr:unnamed protein product [Polarella glacialis]